jgi:hypothetical protein
MVWIGSVGAREPGNLPKVAQLGKTSETLTIVV